MSFLDLYQSDQDQALRIQPNEGTRIPSGFAENLHAAWDDGRLFGQSVARSNSRQAALEDYFSDIQQKTGQDLSRDAIIPDPTGLTAGTLNLDASNKRVAELKAKRPDLDINPIDEDEIDKRAVAKAQEAHRAYQALQEGEKGPGGSVGSFLGSTGAAITDPINILALPVAPESMGAGILASALRWGALAGVSQAAIEAASGAFKEEVQPGYLQSGEPFEQVGSAFLGGAVLGGGTKALGNAWTRVKTGSWPTSVRDAGNIIESEANVANTNIFPGVEGEAAHREALVKTIDDILAGRPVQIDHIITQDFLARSRALTERLQAEQPMRLPVVNQRAFELIAEQERLQARDTELGQQLFNIGPAEGYQQAADQLARVRAVEDQMANAASPAERRALSDRRDELLANTTPEKLEAAAVPIEQRRVFEAERSSIADRLQDIADEHTRLQADYSLMGPLRLPQLGQTEFAGIKPGEQLSLRFGEEPPAAPAKVPPGPLPQVRTPEQMRQDLASPDIHDGMRADLDRARAMKDLQVPGTDENGNHVMVSADAAVDEVDAYKRAAEQIDACAREMAQEAQPLARDVEVRGRTGRPLSTAPITPTLSENAEIGNIEGSGNIHVMHDANGTIQGIYGSREEANAALETRMRANWEQAGRTYGDEFDGAPPREWRRTIREWNQGKPADERIDPDEAGYNSDARGRHYTGGLENAPDLVQRLEALDREYMDRRMPYPGAKAASRYFEDNATDENESAMALKVRKGGK